jgi:ribose/xylose/arabinose/galactoside ABC-type transport system permease subunit
MWLRKKPHPASKTNARCIRRISISYGNYILQLGKFVFSSSVVVAMIVGIALLLVGETSIEFNLTVDFEPLDSIWWILGLPAVSVLLFVILSPLSFLVHRRVFGRKTAERQAE